MTEVFSDSPLWFLGHCSLQKPMSDLSLDLESYLTETSQPSLQREDQFTVVLPPAVWTSDWLLTSACLLPLKAAYGCPLPQPRDLPLKWVHQKEPLCHEEKKYVTLKLWEDPVRVPISFKDF